MRTTGSGRSSKITAEIKKIVHEQMQTDDETTAVQLHTLLNSKLFWRRVQQLSVIKENTC